MPAQAQQTTDDRPIGFRVGLDGCGCRHRQKQTMLPRRSQERTRGRHVLSMIVRNIKAGEVKSGWIRKALRVRGSPHPKGCFPPPGVIRTLIDNTVAQIVMVSNDPCSKR
jgi:hypothetical protein